MPTLQTPRHEAFARAIAAGQNQTDAAGAAGYKAGARLRLTGSELAGRADIRARISELREQIDALFVRDIAENTSYSLADALKDAELAFQMGERRQNGAAMVAAVTLKARLSGLLIERRMEVKTIGEYTEQELDSLLASVDARMAITAASRDEDE